VVGDKSRLARTILGVPETWQQQQHQQQQISVSYLNNNENPQAAGMPP
jgi:hypothetical protein